MAREPPPPPRGRPPSREQRHAAASTTSSLASGAEGDDDDDDGPEGSEASEETGLVWMEEALDLPPESEVFDISDRLWKESAVDRSRFAYRRHVRGEVMIGLGMAPTAASTVNGNIEDVYVKTSTKFAEKMYMSIMIGLGTFELTKGMARCGYVMGPLLFGCLSAVHLFLCHRLSELPYRFRCDIETFGDLAKVSCNSIFWRIVSVLIILSWFGACSIYLTDCLKAVDAVIGCGTRVIPLHYKVALFFLLLPLIFQTNAASMRRASFVSLYSMLAIGAVVILAAVFNGVTDYMGDQTLVFAPAPFKKNATSTGVRAFQDIDFYLVAKGVNNFVLSFTGIAALPYVIADMSMPQHAKLMTTKAWKKITLFQCSVAAFCYFGWGDKMASGLRDPLTQLVKEAERLEDGPRRVIFWTAAVIICVLVLLKTIATFPLCFWLLFRELQGASKSYDGAPRWMDMELQLPWAVERARSMQAGLRVAMLVLTLVPAFLDDYSRFKTFVTCGPSSAVNFTLPAVFAMLGILSHRSRVPAWTKGLRTLADMKQVATGAVALARGTLPAMPGGSAVPSEPAEIEMSGPRARATSAAVPSRRERAATAGSRLVRAPGRERASTAVGRACAARPRGLTDWAGGGPGARARSPRRGTPPVRPGPGLASLGAVGALSAFTVAFTASNMHLGSRKVMYGPDREYHGEVGERDMDKCTNWLV